MVNPPFSYPVLLLGALLFAGLAFALLAFILWLSSLLGWKQWSLVYPGQPLAGQRSDFLFRTGGFAWWACYNNCLRVRILPDGFLVRPVPPFLWFHPWIFLSFVNLAGTPQITGFPRHLRLVFSGPRKLRFTLRLPAEAAQTLPLPQ
jgi:hypothetical protein